MRQKERLFHDLDGNRVGHDSENKIAAFAALWRFIEECRLDQPSENDLKHALIVLGKAAQVPDKWVSGAGDKRARAAAVSLWM